MLIIPNNQRGRRRRTITPPAPAGPVLVAAVYEAATAVTLSFAQPVTVTADSMVAVQVFDGQAGERYMGDDFQILSPTQIRVILYDQDESPVGPITMTVSQPTGIADAGNEEAWAGVTNVTLPFGE